MEIYTVSFFGHRQIENVIEVERKLEEKVSELIRTKRYVEFLVGRDGEFDILASSVVKRIRKQNDYGNCSLIWVMPYMKAEFRNNEREFLDYYDDVEICEQSAKAHYKSAIKIRNRYMADRSDLIICCIQRKTGGAYKTVRYAEKKSKQIINIG